MANTILFITNSEHGQANVILAVAHELAQRPDVEVHVASFSKLQNRVAKLSMLLPDASNAIQFHAIDGLDYKSRLARQVSVHEVAHPAGYGVLQGYRWIAYTLMPWKLEEYHRQLLSIEQIVDKVKPTGIVMEPMIVGAFDVCRKLKQSCMVLSPNSPKDSVWTMQPGLAGFWKYPAMGTGFPCPVPLHLIPVNIYLILRLMFAITTSPMIKQVDAMRKEYGLTNSIVNQFSDKYSYIFPAMFETEFPGLYIPPNLTLTGPIVLPHTPVEECDVQLHQWLSKPGAKTVLVNLGSLFSCTIDQVRQIADGIAILLDEVAEAQVLWKVVADDEVESVVHATRLGRHLEAGKVKVTNWLDVEPYAVLCHPNTVCSVHHGGANSFFEAVSAGVPHVILPIWFDTYDYASRVELLRIGVWGSPTSAPYAEAKELGAALLKVVGDSHDGDEIRRNAKNLAETYRVKYGGNGRKAAADSILKMFGN